MEYKFCLLPGLIMALACSHTALAAKEPLRLAPSSKWNLRYEDDSCRLIRIFGEDKQQVSALFARFGPGDHFRLTLAGQPVRLRTPGRSIYIRFGHHESEQKVGYMSGKLGKRPALILGKHRIAGPTDAEQEAMDRRKPDDPAIELSPIGANRYAAADHVLIKHPFKRQIVLETGSLGKPFAAFSSCIDELMTHWGIDVEKHKNLSRAVEPAESPGRWVKASDYPIQMLRQGEQAIVEFRLSIDKKGKASQCHIQQSTRPQEFDDAVCQSLMRRAEFRPALDSAGNPVASYWRNTVRFEIPY